MKFSKKMIILAAAALLILATSATVFASTSASTPAEILAGLTGNSVAGVTQQRIETQQRYGDMAEEAGVLDQFRAEMNELKEASLAELVAAGTMTQDQADAILARIEDNQADCDGDCDNAGGTLSGEGFRFGNSGSGAGTGTGGYGNRSGDGSCIADEE